MTPSSDADTVIDILNSRDWSTADLVRISYAAARLGPNTTSILGRYGEELVAEAFGGTIASFDQKAFDVRTPDHGDLQVKTYAVGKRPGNIRSFTHDVVTVEVEPSTAAVRSARLYRAADLYASFKSSYEAKYASLGMAWGGKQADRFERGWTISAKVAYLDVTDRFAGASE